MIVKIETYRGWDISFDTDTENFITASDDTYGGPNTKIKKSLSSTRKYIDDFIKDNDIFVPVWVECGCSMFRSSSKIKLIGIRKDGRFVYEDGSGTQRQLSEYTEKDYYLVNPDNELVYKQIKDIEVKKEELNNQIKDLEKQIIKVGLGDIKSKYIK